MTFTNETEINFVEEFTATFNKLTGRNPSPTEIKQCGQLLAEGLSATIVEGMEYGETDLQIKGIVIQAIAKSDNKEKEDADQHEPANENDELTCNIPESICLPIRELIIKLAEEGTINVAKELIDKIKLNRHNHDHESWEMVLRYSGYICFGYVLAYRTDTPGITYYLNWLQDNLSAQQLIQARTEALFTTIKRLVIPTISDQMNEFLDQYLSNLNSYNQTSKKREQMELN